MAVEIPRLVSKIGKQFVIKLDKQTRDILGIKNVGDKVVLKGEDVEYDEKIDYEVKQNG